MRQGAETPAQDVTFRESYGIVKEISEVLAGDIPGNRVSPRLRVTSVNAGRDNRGRAKVGLRWIDVSIPLCEGMVCWPGDDPFSVKPSRRIARGDGCNTSCLTLHTHTGTHIDAPWHFLDTGAGIDEVDSRLFFGDALVIERRGAASIRAEHIPKDGLPARVLFKTDNSDHPVDEPFRADFVALEADAAEALVDAGVRLVGVDYLSVGPYKQDGRLTHHILLEHQVLVVEGLRLGGILPGLYPFVVLPLALRGLDGSPCRAFIGGEKGHG